MQFHSRTIRYAAMAAVSLGVLAACDSDDTLSAPPASVSAAALAVELSSPIAAPGQQIAVAIANISDQPIGGVQGFLRFDPSQLAFRGQLRDEGDRSIMLINDADADAGELRVAILDPANLKHSAAMVFDVIGSRYASSISFVPEEVATNGSPVKIIEAEVASAFMVNASLQATPDAQRMTITDWLEVIEPSNVAMTPGNIIPGLRFGDTNGSSTITLADALYVINVSVGGNELIIGSDGTGPNGNVDGVVAGNVVPANIDGTPQDLGEAGDPNPPGLEANGTRLLTLADGLAIVNESVGADQPVVGELIPGRPATPVSNRVVVNTDITTNTTWTANNIYELVGYITVDNGATLTIEAGTLIEGRRSTTVGEGAALYISRNGRIDAQGTALQPIVMTCTQGAGDPERFKGCWGGVSILGNATTNTGNANSPVIPGRADVGGCLERAAEGAPQLYGGCNDDDNSGTMRYVRIEYAGFRFSATNELNSLALYGVGRGTTLDYIQVHGGLDDAVEMFGGTVNMKHLYLTATSDDAYDHTDGWRGKAQFIVIQHDGGDSDNGFENDNAGANDALPRSAPTVYNVTMVSDRNYRVGVTESQNRGLLIRRGARPHYFNFHVEGFTTALDVDDASTCVDFNTSTGFEFKNMTFALNQRLDDADGSDPAGCGASELDVINAPGAGNQVLAASPLLEPLSYIVPDFRPSASAAVIGATPPADGFFDVTATYVGGVAPATATKNNAPWYAGWTRGWRTSVNP
jgi:hypothetical protein